MWIVCLADTWQTIHMKCQGLFSSENKKKKSKLSSALVVIGALRVKYSDRQDCANSWDPDQMLQNVASVQGLYCLPLMLLYLDTLTSSEMDFIKILVQVWWVTLSKY